MLFRRFQVPSSKSLRNVRLLGLPPYETAVRQMKSPLALPLSRRFCGAGGQRPAVLSVVARLRYGLGAAANCFLRVRFAAAGRKEIDISATLEIIVRDSHIINAFISPPNFRKS